MKNIIYIICIILFTTSSNAISQNLFPNPSFEQFTGCPFGNSVIANNFMDSCLSWSSTPGNSLEYFNCGWGGFIISDGSYPSCGTGCIGGITAPSGYKEEAQAKLLSPLIIGKIYTLKFDIRSTFPSGVRPAPPSCMTFGFDFSNSSSSGAFNPQVSINASKIPTGPYETFTFSFTADSAFDSVVIGGFTIIDSLPTCSSLLGFYWNLDNLSLSENITDSISIKHSLNCSIDTVSFSYTDTLLVDSSKWNFGDTISGSNNFSNAKSPKHIYISSGTYDIEVIVYKECREDTSYKTIVITLDSDSISINHSLNCAVDMVSFLYTDTLLVDSSKWNFGDTISGSNNFSNAKSPKHIYTSSGTYNIKAIIYSYCGLDTLYKTITVTLNPLSFNPNINFTDSSLCENDSVTIIASGGHTYLWEPSSLLLNNTQASIKIISENIGYDVIINDTVCNLSDTLSTNISVTNCIIDTPKASYLYIPNAFSPNNDGINDIFLVRSTQTEAIVLRIFDRWGKKVFESTNEFVGWNGSILGTGKSNMANEGVYTYVIFGKFTDESDINQKGNITLVR